jgi:hypothetical protein
MDYSKKERNKILVLGSSHGRKIGPLLQEILGTKFKVVLIYKPNTPVTKVVGDLGKPVEDMIKQVHNVIVRGPESSLDRNYHYLIEEDVNSIAERTTNINVGSVGHFKEHDEHWMNGRPSCVNLNLIRPLWGMVCLTLVSLTLPVI